MKLWQTGLGIVLTFGVACLAYCAERTKANGPESMTGDARGFGGGDFLDPRLIQIRTDLKRSLSLIGEGKAGKTLCQVAECPASLSPAQCETVRRMTAAQVAECRKLLNKMAAQAKGKSPLFAFEITSDALSVADSNGGKRSVAAMTELSKKGPLRLNRNLIQDLSRDELTALVAHELGHKVDGPGFLKDTETVAHFGTGRDLLDTTGVSLALFTAANRIPAQSPPAFPKSIAQAEYCGAVASASAFRAGLGTDTLAAVSPLPPSREETDSSRLETTKAWLASAEVRGLVLEGWFHKYFGRAPAKDEKMALVLQMSHGANSPAVLATMLKDAEYTNSRRVNDEPAYLTALYRDTLGRGPQGAELQTSLEKLHALGKQDFLLQWLQQDDTMLNRLVTEWYSRWLNREPWAAETRSHVAQLKTGMDWEEVQAGLLAGSEYLALQKVRSLGCPQSGRGLSSK